MNRCDWCGQRCHASRFLCERCAEDVAATIRAHSFVRLELAPDEPIPFALTAKGRAATDPPFLGGTSTGVRP
jgi:hypothetical protein